MNLTHQEIQHFQKIIFQPCDDAELNRLTPQQKEKLRQAVGQKIAYEAVFKKSFRQQQVEQPQNFYRTPSCLSYVCCCLYPEYYKDLFQLSASLFRRRFLGTFVFWRDDFLQITQERKAQAKLTEKEQTAEDKNKNEKPPSNTPELVEVKEVRREPATQKPETNLVQLTEDKPKKGPDLYGPLWLAVTYMILLALCANLNEYFSSGGNPSFSFKKDYLSSALLMTIFIRIAQTLVYTAIIGCLDGQMSNTESAHLVGYSLSLYFIPTILCSIASNQVHTVALLLAVVLRCIFLGRNYTKRMLDRKGIAYMIILAVQALYYFVVSATFFSNYYKGQPTSTVATTAPKAAHLLRNFFDHGVHL